MSSSVTLFISLFTMLLAIINPLEAIPVFLNLLQGKGEEEHRRVTKFTYDGGGLAKGGLVTSPAPPAGQEQGRIARDPGR